MAEETHALPLAVGRKPRSTLKVLDEAEVRPMQLSPVVEAPPELVLGSLAQAAIVPVEPSQVPERIGQSSRSDNLARSSQSLLPGEVPYAGIAAVREHQQRVEKRQHKVQRMAQAAQTVSSAPARITKTIVVD